MAVLTTEKLTANVGAEIVGLDAERLLHDDSLPALLLDALEEHGVLVFRRLNVDDDAHVALSRRLGRVESRPGRPVPEIATVSLDPNKSPIAEYLKGTFDWHIDGTTDDVPNRATILRALAVAPTGGETEFASTYGGYEALTDAEKDRFGGMRARHCLAASQRRRVDNPTPEQEADWALHPQREHPLVWRHRSGRRSLVVGTTADYVIGVSAEESEAILADLLDRATAPERTYRHEWGVGDLVIWDNCGVLHRACPYDPDSPREMHRTVLLGDEPIG